MRITQKLFDLAWGHKIHGVWFSWINHVKVVAVYLELNLFWIRKAIVDKWDKVYFDLYEKKDLTQKYTWFATIEKDWIDLWYKKRNKIKQMIEKHFKSEYVVGNYRNNFEK